MSYIVCKQIVKAYRVSGHEIVALRGIDFEMEQGEMVAIIGPSGAGKSSLLNLLGGLDTPTAGTLFVDGQNIGELKGARLASYRLRSVGFVWQQVERNLLAHRTALANVTLPMMLNGMPLWERRKRALELLDAVGMAEHAHKRPAQLSGGQQQRAAIAVSLANHPHLFLADEPTGALDRATGKQVMELLGNLRQKYGLTTLMVTHDMTIAAYADRVLTLRDGALGQDLTHAQEPTLGTDGRLSLPDQVRQHLTDGRIAVEIRPEGVLLRTEKDEDDMTAALVDGMMPQDAAPKKARGWWPFGRKGQAAKPAKGGGA
jgi:ABC-type lipoprotein export system ATPase subunit